MAVNTNGTTSYWLDWEDSINDGVTVYLDENLRRHEIVYPAVGSDHSGVKLTIAELERCSGYKDWVDVCKEAEQC